MSGRDSVRSAARRAIGVPDATEVGELLRHLQATLTELQARVDVLRIERTEDAADLTRLREEVRLQREVILEQTAAIEHLQGQLASGSSH